MSITFLRDDKCRHPVRWLVDTPQIRIAIFFDSYEAIPKMAKAGIIDNRTFLYFHTPWYCSGIRFQRIRQIVEETASNFAIPDLYKRITLFASSKFERVIAQSVIGEIDCSVVPFTAYHSHILYNRIECKKKYDAVMCARLTAFKRHYLAREVKNVAYIANDWKGGDGHLATVDISNLSPAIHLKGLNRDQVAKVLSESYVGLILSEMEGACYANIEYLLCGLPVVSTPSFGGRDEFYDDYVALVCPAIERDVRFSVDALKALLMSGAIEPSEVRRRTIARMQAFRRVAAESFDQKAAYIGTSVPAGTIALDRMESDHRLDNTLNLYIEDVLF